MLIKEVEEKTISEYNGGLFKENLKDIKLKDVVKKKIFLKMFIKNGTLKNLKTDLIKKLSHLLLKRLNPIYINLLIISYFDFSEEKTNQTSLN